MKQSRGFVSNISHSSKTIKGTYLFRKEVNKFYERVWYAMQLTTHVTKKTAAQLAFQSDHLVQTMWTGADSGQLLDTNVCFLLCGMTTLCQSNLTQGLLEGWGENESFYLVIGTGKRGQGPCGDGPRRRKNQPKAKRSYKNLWQSANLSPGCHHKVFYLQFMQIQVHLLAYINYTQIA